MAIVLPEGVFGNKSQGYIPKKRQKKIKIAVAKNCGHDRRGRTTNSKNQPLPDDFV